MSNPLTVLLLWLFGQYVAGLFALRARCRNRLGIKVLRFLEPPKSVEMSIFGSVMNSIMQMPNANQILEEIQGDTLEDIKQKLKRFSVEEMGELLEMLTDEAKHNKALGEYPLLGMAMQVVPREKVKELIETERFLAQHRRKHQPH